MQQQKEDQNQLSFTITGAILGLVGYAILILIVILNFLV